MRRSWVCLAPSFYSRGCCTLRGIRSCPAIFGPRTMWRGIHGLWCERLFLLIPKHHSAGLDSCVRGKNPLGRCTGGSLWDSKQDLSAAWRRAHYQCSGILSSGGSGRGSLCTVQPQCCGVGSGWVGIELESHYERYVCCHANVLCKAGRSRFLAGVLHYLHEQAYRN
jgi:hypothetical protein